MTWTLHNTDCLAGLRDLSDNSVQTCITSPPYWSLRDYGVEGQLGLEPTPEEYVAHLVEVFQEVRRVLRPDGTLWLNLGDTYASRPNGSIGATTLEGGRASQIEYRKAHSLRKPGLPGTGALKHKDLVGIPWRVVFALQGFALVGIDEIAALCRAIDSRNMPALDAFRAGFALWKALSGMGWYWHRSDIIWAKPNPMPESVTDRPTKAHEYLFLLAKSARYYYDAEAIKEEATMHLRDKRYGPGSTGRGRVDEPWNQQGPYKPHKGFKSLDTTTGRNRRSVWTVSPRPFPEAHFATFPPELIEPCVLAGSSPMACPTCGAPWERVTDKAREYASGSGRSGNVPTGKGSGGTQARGEEHDIRMGPTVSVTTIGWQPTCSCEGNDGSGRSLVLDPFAGAGTTLLVAERFGRDSIGFELNPEYCDISRRRLSAVQVVLNA